MNPSFRALFERSTYSRRSRQTLANDAAMERLFEQRERFAGAMLAFGLSMDTDFRRHFLRSVCGVDETTARSEWEVLIEPENWGDLVLANLSRTLLVVVELKIDSDLKPHQNWFQRVFEAVGRYRE